MLERSPVRALLGPTNTGKTHRAIERMLSYESGILGLPLRLLAREVYDRVAAKVGQDRVALVTGEEKRIPRRPSYWICTVEAMPRDLEVEFLAVDEVQLAADEQRGHVFTERLLSARGRRETYFLGAQTMTGVVRELVPTAEISSHPRLSRLSFTGAAKLGRVPPRSALIAFSMAQVYELAERVRALRGGTAVVLGALSPRTRNAQVALFESGEVDYIVATDAIGMGLNLDVKHVAFGALRKFDGRDVRELAPAELGQIAGRAGRHLADGTFGTLAPLELPPPVALAIEGHAFSPVRRVFWRNADLNFGSVPDLVESLRRPPPSRRLAPAPRTDDLAVLERLALDPSVRALARGREAVRLLWEVAQIPDFRKILFEAHASLLAEVFRQLAGPAGVVSPAFVEARVAELDDTGGDLEAIMDRIASIRTWTYISSHAGWVERAEDWQARARAVEDRLSDALHERLLQRFVERGGRRRNRASRGRAAGRAVDPSARAEAPSDAPGAVRPDHPFAALAGLRARVPGAAAEAVPPADDAAWVDELEAAPDARFRLGQGGEIFLATPPGSVSGPTHPSARGALGRLVAGPRLQLPDVRLTGLSDLESGARARAHRRLVAFARSLLDELLAPLRPRDLAALPAALRGVLYQLEAGLGTALTSAEADQLAGLTGGDRALLGALTSRGIVLGERVLFARSALRRSALEHRLALASAYFDPPPSLPPPGAVSARARRGVDPRAQLAIGYPVFAGRALRADVAERAFHASARGDAKTAALAGLLGCPAKEVDAIVGALRGPPEAPNEQHAEPGPTG